MKRTIEIDVPVSPTELAEAFCEMDSEEQAEFFAEVWRLALNWGGAGWCQQSHSIIAMSGPKSRDAIRTLASHMPAEDIEWIVAASKDA